MPPSFTDPIDVHLLAEKRQQQDKLLAASPMLSANKDAITEFVDFCTVDPRVGAARIIRYLYALRVIGELVEKPFRTMTEADMTRLLVALQNKTTAKGRPYSPASMQEFRKAISKFWRWLYFADYQGDAPPPIRRIIRTSLHKPPGEPEIYSKEQIRSIIAAMRSARNKAFFACLYDLECRVGELLTRRMSHVRHTDDGEVQILVEATKTAVAHWETLFESVPQFTTWLRLHPRPDEPAVPLWIMEKTTAQGERVLEPWTYPAARKTFLTVCRRLGIRHGRQNKMHMFRRSKATHDLADGVPITYIESRGSWTKGSQALRDCYLSVIQRDKDNAYRTKYKLATNQTMSPASDPLQRCRRCQSIVEQDARFCPRCGLPRTPHAAAQQSQLNVAQFVDENMLSELVKRFVTQELRKNQGVAAWPPTVRV